MSSTIEAKDPVHEVRLGRVGLQSLLRELETDGGNDGVSAYMVPGGFQSTHEALAQRLKTSTDHLELLSSRVQRSSTGAALFWSEEKRLAILPAFPLDRQLLLNGWDTSPLREMMGKDYLLGLVLLRLGRFAVGVFQGQELVASKTDTRYVKGKHSAGGQSQKRFERIREKQAQELFKKTCSVVEERFAPYDRQMDYIFLGGEQFTLNGFLQRCSYLQGRSSKIVGRRLNVRTPKHNTLQGALDLAWESRVLMVR